MGHKFLRLKATYDYWQLGCEIELEQLGATPPSRSLDWTNEQSYSFVRRILQDIIDSSPSSSSYVCVVPAQSAVREEAVGGAKKCRGDKGDGGKKTRHERERASLTLYRNMFAMLAPSVRPSVRSSSHACLSQQRQ